MVALDTPPLYWAFGDNKTAAGIAVTLGDLVMDSNMQLLDDDNEPIVSFFAVGNCLGGRYVLPIPASSRAIPPA